MSKPIEALKNIAAKTRDTVGTKPLVIGGTIAGFIIAGIVLNAVKGPETLIVVNEAPIDPEPILDTDI